MSMKLMATVAKNQHFVKAREFEAWQGLVARQYSTGGKPRLGRITKATLIACMRTLIVILNTMVKNGVKWGQKWRD